MSNWSQFAKNLAALDEGLSDAVRTLYGPPEAVSGHCEGDAEWASDSEEDREGYMESLANDGDPNDGIGYDIDDFFRPWPSYGVESL